MGDVVAFPGKRKKPKKLHKVFVTFTGDWEGENAEVAAMELAKILCNVVEPFVEFHGKGKVAWGEIKTKKNPT